MKSICFIFMIMLFSACVFAQQETSVKTERVSGVAVKSDTVKTLKQNLQRNPIETPVFRYVPPENRIKRIRSDSTMIDSPVMKYGPGKID